MTTQTEITQRNHHRAVRFFWGLLDRRDHGQPHRQRRPRRAAIPPRHRRPDRCRRCASHRPPCRRARHRPRRPRGSLRPGLPLGGQRCCGHRRGRFAVSFLALRDLMLAIGYSSATAWVFPAIIDTAVAVSTLMLVALGDKPARRPRTVTTAANTKTQAAQRVRGRTQSAWSHRLHRPGGVGSRRKEARTALCIGTTRPGTDMQLSANRGDGGRCRPCIGTDCLRRDYTARGDGDCSAGIKPRRCVDQRCCQGIWHQLPDCAADRGGRTVRRQLDFAAVGHLGRGLGLLKDEGG